MSDDVLYNPIVLLMLAVAVMFGLAVLPAIIMVAIEAIPLVLAFLAALWLFHAIF